MVFFPRERETKRKRSARRTVISMRPAGCPPISMSKNTTGLDMTTILIQRKNNNAIFFVTTKKTVVVSPCQKRTNEKVPTKNKRKHTQKKMHKSLSPQVLSKVKKQKKGAHTLYETLNNWMWEKGVCLVGWIFAIFEVHLSDISD